MMKFSAALLASAAFCTCAFAQPAPTPQSASVVNIPATPAVEQAVAAPIAAELPAHSNVLLRLNTQLSSRDNREGDTFSLTVVQDVSVNGRVVIPSGTRAIGQVTWRTGRGGFGKSGKLEIMMRYLELGGRRIPLAGYFRQDGEGNTAATVGAVVAAGIVGGLIVRGHSARIPEGTEFTALTVDAIPVMIPSDGAAAMIADSYTPSPVATRLGKRENQLRDSERERERAQRRS